MLAKKKHMYTSENEDGHTHTKHGRPSSCIGHNQHRTLHNPWHAKMQPGQQLFIPQQNHQAMFIDHTIILARSYLTSVMDEALFTNER